MNQKLLTMRNVFFVPDYVEIYCQEVLGKSPRQAFEDNFKNFKKKLLDASLEHWIQMQEEKEK